MAGVSTSPISYSKYFSGRRVLVTGAAHGLGYAIVKKFYDCGAVVIALDHSQNALNELKKEFENIITVCSDLRNWEQTREAVLANIPIDHLVNNAAISGTSYFEDVTPDQIDQMFAVNFKAMVNVSQAVAIGMKTKWKEEGTIVNISSVFDSTPSKGISMYSCSKAAVLMLTKSMALELGDKGIRVNCVSPAPTAQLKEMFVSSDPRIVQETQKILDRQVIKRPVQPSEAADIVLFLSSPSSAMMTGQDLNVDGGLFCR